MAWALRDAPDVPAHCVGVLIGLANHAGPDGRGAYPSQRLLASYARKTVRQVRTDLRKLEELGLIRPGDPRLVEHLPADKRPQVWDLAIERVSQEADEERAEVHFRPPRATTGSPLPPRAEVSFRSRAEVSFRQTVLMNRQMNHP
mgnify:CR=1 FL=1